MEWLDTPITYRHVAYYLLSVVGVATIGVSVVLILWWREKW